MSSLHESVSSPLAYSQIWDCKGKKGIFKNQKKYTIKEKYLNFYSFGEFTKQIISEKARSVKTILVPVFWL